MKKNLLFAIIFCFISLIAQGAMPVGYTWRTTTNGVRTAFTAISSDYKCAIGIAWNSTERTSSGNATDQYEIGAGIPTDFTGTFVIPSFLKDYAYYVTEIGYKAFYNCEGITSVSIPQSITYIDYLAFRGCKGLKEVTIPGSVSTIDGCVFSYCTGLESVTLNEGLREINEEVFHGCTSLTSIDIPHSVTTIGGAAFGGCNNLDKVVVHWREPIQISSSVFSNASNATLFVPKGAKSSYASAEVWKGFKNIEEFEDDSYFDVVITSIGNGSILCNNETIKNTAKSVVLPKDKDLILSFNPDEGYRVKSVKVDGTEVSSSISNNQYTISSINSNKTVVVEFEESDILVGKSVEGIDITFKILSEVDKICQVGNGTGLAIKGSESGVLTIPSSVDGYTVTTVAMSAFEECYYLTKVIIPNTVTNIEAYAFKNSSHLSQIDIPNSVVSIGEESFWGTPWYEQKDNGPVYAGKVFYCYKGTMSPNTNFVFIDGVTGIAEGAFERSEGLCSITIPNSVKCINERAFKGCSSLSTVNSEISVPFEIQNDVFEGLSSNALLNVPYGTKDAYLQYPGWISHFNVINEEKGPSFSLSIQAIGNGIVNFDNTSVRGETILFSVAEGASPSISLIADEGWRLKSVMVNDIDVSSDVIDNQYIISGISGDINVVVEFEIIPTPPVAQYFSLVYKVDGDVYKTYEIKEGETITPEAAPTKTGYTFSGWSTIPEIMPAEDVTITGSFTINKYHLVYKVDGEEYKNYEVDYNSVIAPEKAPTKESYVFSGWSDIPETMPDHDVIITGSFERYFTIGNVVRLINFIMKGNATTSDIAIYDLNNDNILNIGDIILVVKWILSNDAGVGSNSAETRASNTIDFTQYTATQFDIKTTSNTNIKGITLVGSMVQTHQLMYQQKDANTYTVVVYSLSNQLMKPENGSIVDVDTDNGSNSGLSIMNMVVSDVYGGIQPYDGTAITTNIRHIENNGSSSIVYDLKGNRYDGTVRNKKGIYIINGKKVVVK